MTRRKDFLAANSGVRVPMPPFLLLVRPNGSGKTRIGFTVSRKVGNAVCRNRQRRRLKEASRLLAAENAGPAFTRGADHVFIARNRPELPFDELMALMRKSLEKAARRLEKAGAAGGDSGREAPRP